MTEQEWLACTDPEPMLRFLRARFNDARKARLFGCGYLRQELDGREECRQAVMVSERFADGRASRKELRKARTMVEATAQATLSDLPVYQAIETTSDDAWAYFRRAMTPEDFCTANAAVFCTPNTVSASKLQLIQEREQTRHALYIRVIHDLFGPLPFRRPIAIDSAWLACLAWNDGTIPKLAQAIYDERAFDRLPILADALEEAGCHNSDILNHCRSEGPHVRGCWAVDLILGKE